MHYQLFFPGKRGNAPACLRECGLDDFIAGASEAIATVNDQGGLLVGWGGSIGYVPEKQRWVDSGLGYLVGFWADGCTPEDLERSAKFRGYDITLSNGTVWTVPVAAELPGTFRLVGVNWKTVRKPQFDAFWNRSEVWFRRFVLHDLEFDKIAEDEKIDPQALTNDWMDFAIAALRQNYRITPFIASELELLDSTDRIRIVFTVVDGMNITSVFEELQAKKAAESAGIEKKETLTTLVS